jgi:membrane protein
MGTLGRTVKEYRRDNITDWAAALTYYAVLSLFPALLVLVALLGVVGQYPETTNALLQIVRRVGPASAVQTFRGPVEGVVANKGGAGALLGVGLVAALWSASGYVGAFMRASNVIYGVRERRFWKQRPLQLSITLLMVFLLTVAAVAIVLTGPLATAVGGVLGLSDLAITIWSLAKWPVLAILVMAIVSVLYYLSPNVRQREFRMVTPGAILAVVVWVLASLAFAFYVANFGSYNATYGALGAIVVFLVWLYISNNALLLGVEFNAEVERARELKAGLPAEERLHLAARDPR